MEFIDLKAQYAALKPSIDARIARVLQHCQFILGPEVAEMEEKLAAWTGSKHCIGVGNGLDALHLIVRAYGIGEGDEVIVPANTFIATWLAVSYSGANVTSTSMSGFTSSKAATISSRAAFSASDDDQPARIMVTGSWATAIPLSASSIASAPIKKTTLRIGNLHTI